MKRYSFAVSLITTASCVFALAANLVSGRLGMFGPYAAPMGVFFFPFIYILSDVVSDVYGYGLSRKIAWMTALCNLVFVGLIMLVVTIIRSASWCLDIDNAIKLLMIGTTGMLRVTIAGVTGAVLGGWTNDIIFQLFRHRDGFQHFYKRKLWSSLGAEIVDTTTFITLAFAFTPAWSFTMYAIQFVLKYGVEVVTAPLASLLKNKIRSMEGEDVFEDRNQFDIFGRSRTRTL